MTTGTSFAASKPVWLPVVWLLLAREFAVPSFVPAADWPQFMGNAAHMGDAANETLQLPLGLAAQVQLDDAIMTAPAVVEGLAYVVDQMGTAYAIDPVVGRIVWKSAPDGPTAMGFNTSSPCVAGGRVYFGTTAGNFHILNASDGSVVKTVSVGMPVLSAPVLANDSIYFQSLDAVLRCLDLEGNERWRWDHYARYQEPPELTKAKERERGHPGSYDRPHHGGGEVAVSGKRIVTSFGWDIVCVEDAGSEARLMWCNRAPSGRDGAAPMSPSIAGDSVYYSGMGADGHKALTRLSLTTGERVKEGWSHKETYPWITPTVRGELIAYRDSSYGKNGIVLFDQQARRSVTSWRDEHESTPIASSHVLTKNHLVATTLRGEVVVVELAAKPSTKPFRWKTPSGQGIGSTPAVVDGSIYFGGDDGCFYVLAPGGNVQPTADLQLAIRQPRSKFQSATGTKSTWPSTYGNPGNTAFVNDPGLKPPLKIRWATRGFGHFLSPGIATESDFFTVSLNGLVTCQEQATGRLRWRVQMPGPEWATGSGLLAAEGRLFVPRPTFGSQEGAFYCLDQSTGKLLWQAEIGGRYIWERAAPVAAGGKVAFGFATKGTPPGTVIQAWDAATGEPDWQVELNVAGGRSGSIGGCTDGKVLYFTAGAGAWQWKQEGSKQRGEAVAIEAATGKVLWRTSERFGATYPVLDGGRLLLNGDALQCVSPQDCSLLWQRQAAGYTRISVGDDYLILRGYGGHGTKLRLDDGKDYPGGKELGGPTHACSPVALTPNYSLAITVGGLNVRDVRTGELLWLSPGFAPRGYGGHGTKLRLDDGKDYPGGKELGGPTHACSPVALTPNYSLAITVGGLNVRDVRTGELLWLSSGFAPRGCVNPVLANGRVFWPSAASGTIFCWEPTVIGSK